MGLRDPRARTGMIAGAVAQFLAVCIAFLGTYVLGLAFAPTALGQAVIAVLPGWISIPLIGLLEHLAQPLLVLGLTVGFVVLGALAGALAYDARRSDALVLAVGAGPWIASVALAGLLAPSAVPLTSALADAALGAAAFAGALALLESARDDQRAADPAAAGSRRRVLLGAMAVAAAVAAGTLVLGQRVRAAARPLATLRTARRLVHAETVTAADPTFDAIPRLTPRLTENKAHYTVDTALIDPEVDERGWRLRVAGLVQRPFEIGYEELLDLEAVEQLHTLECISNEIGGDLIGTALWTGVRLRDLLERAGPSSTAYDVVFTSVDGYTDSIPLAKAMEPRTLVAYLMNGYPVPPEHGFPARLLVPDIYGMKNVKWLSRVELVANDFQGYWMERGWSDIAIMNTHSRIDTPTGTVRFDGGVVPVAGIANAGARGIRRVEVSTDGGRAWNEAELERELGPLTWVRWRYRWTPSTPGTYTVVARATDGRGETQTSVRRNIFPAGSTGYDQVDVKVVG